MSASRVFRMVALCFLAGTAIGLFFSWSFGVALLPSSVALAVAVSWFPKRRVFGIFCALFCAAMFSGAWFRAARDVSMWNAVPDTDAILERAEIVREPVQKESSKQAVFRSLSCSTVCPETFVLGIFPSFADIEKGDVLSLSCRLEKPERFSPDFDYPKVLATNGIGYVCRFPKSWKKESVSVGWFSTPIHSMRGRIERSIESAISEPEAGLVLGLLVGGDGRLPEKIQDEFSRTGLSHIVAVSGYNVSMVAILLMSALVVCGLYRQRAFWGALLGIGLFTLLVGAPASAVRAAIMAIVALSATRLGRLGNPTNAILCAVCVMLYANPLLLRYDVGFQLSFAATVGIFLFTPFALLSLRLGDVLATTVAAELFVLPIMLFHFHAVPTLSLFANMLVLPLVPLAMLLGSIAAFFGMVFPVFAAVFGFPAFLVAHGILAIVEFFSARSFASVAVLNFGLGAVALWYGALFVSFLFLRRKFS